MITQRAFIIGVVGVCFYIIALVNQLPSYYSILTWLAITVLVSSAGVALLSLQGVECKWRVLRAKATASLAHENLETAQDRVLEVAPASNRFTARLQAMQSAARAEEAQEQGLDGGGPMLEFEIENRGTLNKTGVLVDVRLRHLSRSLVLTRRFMIESLPSGTSLSSTLTLRGLPRGRYEIVEIVVVGSDVLGLYRSRKRVYSNDQARATVRAQHFEKAATAAKTSWQFYMALAVFGVVALLVGDFASRFTRPGSIAAQIGGVLSIIIGLGSWRGRQSARAWLKKLRPDSEDQKSSSPQLCVGPATVAAANLPEASAADLSGHEASRSNALGRSDELRGTRPYVAGDDLRTVHWKSTARLGQLVVREFHRPARSQSLVIWDGARSSSATSSTRSDEERSEERDDDIELCLALTASICRGWVERNLSCTLLRLDSRSRLVKNAQGANGSALSPFVDALADADALRETPLGEALSAHLSAVPVSGNLFIVSSRDVSEKLPDDLTRAIGSLRARGTRIVVFGVTRAVKKTGAKSGLRAILQREKTASIEIESRTDASGARVVCLKRNRAATISSAELSACLRALLQNARATSSSSTSSSSTSFSASASSVAVGNGSAKMNSNVSSVTSSTAGS